MLPLRDNVPTRSTPVVTIGLIAANFLVWFWELGGRGVDYHVLKDGFYPCSVEAPCRVPATIPIHPLPWYEGAFSSMFLHASWAHILGNMLFLWIFGNNVEDALGRVRFLFWYLSAGLFATATQTVVTLAAGTVLDAGIPNIGASGAIAGVLGAYFVLLPRARVLTLIGIFPVQIPAVFFLAIWIGLQAWSGGMALLAPQGGGGTAFFAHIGGFAFGVATVRLVAVHRPVIPAARFPVY
jgi:membrane associated rhomboid family serine protease